MVELFLCEKIATRTLEGRVVVEEVVIIEITVEEAMDMMKEEIGVTVDTAMIEMGLGEVAIEMIMMIEEIAEEDMMIEGAGMIVIDTTRTTVEAGEIIMTDTVEEDIHTVKEIFITAEMIEGRMHPHITMALDNPCII